MGLNPHVLAMILHSDKVPTTTLSSKDKNIFNGQWCGSIGRAVASDTRGPRFESSHRQDFILDIVTVSC